MDDSEITIRKLAWASFSFTAGICLEQFFLKDSQIVLFAVFTVIFAAAFIFIKGLWRLRVCIFAVFIVAGVLWNTVYATVFLSPVMELDGSTKTITAVAQDRLRDCGGYSRVTIRVSGQGTPSFRAMLYDFDGILPNIRPGDELTGTFSLKRADKLHGEAYTGQVGNGILLLAYPEGKITLTGQRSPLYFPRMLMNKIEDEIDILFPEDVSAFQKALLTGEKTDYFADGELSRDMSHAGLAHVVSVSGMHVSFLVGLIIITAGRRRAFIFGVPIILLFMLMTGMTPSIVRAGLMYLALLAAPVLKRENDTVTILGFVLAAILFQNPMAIHSIGLQLSFSSMMGILLLSGQIFNYLTDIARNAMKIKYLRWILAGAFRVLSMSLGATLFSMPLVAIHFEYLSVYSPLTNLLTYFVVSCVFCLGYFACAIGAVFPVLGVALATFIAFWIRYIFGVVGLISHLPANVIYMENPIYIQWMVLAVVLFVAAWFLRGGNRFRPIFPVGLSTITLCFAILVTSATTDNSKGEITVLDVGQGQSIVMHAYNTTVMIDCGGKGILEDVGEIAAQYLLAQGITRVGVLVLTHLHEDHVNGVVSLMELVQVEKLFLAPGLDDSDNMLEEILKAAQDADTEVCYVTSDTQFSCGSIELTVFAPLTSGEENERGLIIRGSIGEFDALITGDVGVSTERELVETKEIGETELLVVGHHGSKYSTGLELVEELRPKYSVISVGYNSYGHPTTQAIERATGFDSVLLRTDLNGNITFDVGEYDG